MAPHPPDTNPAPPARRGMLNGVGGTLRSDAYGAFVSCDFRDMSHLLPSVIGFSQAALGGFNRLMELHQVPHSQPCTQTFTRNPQP